MLITSRGRGFLYFFQNKQRARPPRYGDVKLVESIFRLICIPLFSVGHVAVPPLPHGPLISVLVVGRFLNVTLFERLILFFQIKYGRDIDGGFAIMVVCQDRKSVV